MGRQKLLKLIILIAAIGFLCLSVIAMAGSLEPNMGPNTDGSQMYTLDQIYERINSRKTSSKMNNFTEPSSGPESGTMHTLNEIYNLVGVRAPVARTGQTSILPINPASAGSDGDLQKGVTWPNPRFTDNNNGTVSDNLTGLVWLKNANCTDTVGGIIKNTGSLSWYEALAWSNNLAAGNCGLIDGSKIGQWRLPNIKELISLIDYGHYYPALSNASGSGKWKPDDAFINVMSHDHYWSSSTINEGTNYAYTVGMYYGGVNYTNQKNLSFFVWPVRNKE